MQVIDDAEASRLYDKVGYLGTCKKISKRTSSCLPLLSVKLVDGSVLELLKYTYSQYLHNYIIVHYTEHEVRS